MPDFSKRIIYLSDAQRQELFTNGSITVDGTTITYSDNDIYVTPQSEPVTDVRVNGTSVTSAGVANIPVAVQTDDTLSIEGAAADAKAVGDAIRNASSQFPGALTVDVLYNKLNYDTYNVVQGGCVCGDYLYVCFTIISQDNSIKLRKLSLTDYSVAQEATLAIDHGNSVAAHDGKLYIAGIADQTIYVVNTTTLSIEQSHTLNYSPLGLCVNGDGNLIVLKTGLYLDEYSLEDFTLIHSYNPLETELKHGANQADIEYCDGYYYLLLSAPKHLYVYDDSLTVIKRLTVPERLERISLMETEFITALDDGRFIIGWNNPLLPYNKYSSPVVYENIFTVADPRRGNTNNTEQNINGQYCANAQAFIYVKRDYTGNYSDGSSQYPYVEVQQALNDVNIPGAQYFLYVKPGTYAPVYAIGKIFTLGAWPNSGENLSSVTINSIIAVGCSMNIENVVLTSHANAGDVALRLEGNTACYADIAQNNQYSVYITVGASLFTNGYNPVVTSAGGIMAINCNTTRSQTYTKRISAAKILGRAKLYEGTAKSGSINLMNSARFKHYTLICVTLSVDGHNFHSVASPAVATDIPFEFYSSGNRVHGTLTLTPNSSAATATVAFSCMKDSSSYTPSSYNLVIDGVL